MARPRVFDKPMTAAERMRRYRRKKRLLDVKPLTYRAPRAVTEPVSSAVAKPLWRFDPRALIG